MSSGGLEALFAGLRELQGTAGLRVEVEGQNDLYEVMLFPPASESEIAAAQTWPGSSLPSDFVEFWRFTNGANLFVNDSGLHGVGVASTDLISDLQREEGEFYGQEAMAGYCVFARVNGSGDFLVFRLSDGAVLDGIHSEQPHEWRVVAAGFARWLETLIENRGRYYWLEVLYTP